MGDSQANYWTRFGASRVQRRRVLQGGAALSGLTALALAGCSSSNNNNNKPANSNAPAANNAPSNAPSAASTSRPAATPVGPSNATPAAGAAQALATANPSLKTGGTINGAFVVANVPLNPYQNTTYSSQEIAGFAYSRLFAFLADSNPTTTLSRIPVPELVQSYQIPDPTTYVMKLRTDAMFHPPLNRPLTSADVLASYQAFTTEPKNTNNQVFAPIIDSLTAPDANTIQFKLKQPYAPFLNKLANPQYLWIMSQDAATGKIDPSQQLVGTGPWIWNGATPTAYNYKKNPNFFRKGLPYADAVILNVIPTTATQESQFQSGALDTLGVPVTDVDSMKKAVPKANVVNYVGNLLAFLFFSDVTTDSIFKDARARQAASMALDRQGLMSLVYNGQGAWDNIINPGLGKWWLDPQSAQQGDSAKYFKHDPQSAKQLLQAAGYTGQPVKFIYPNDAYGDVYNSASDAVRGMLADGGFNIQVQTVTYLKDYITPDGIFNKGAPPNSIV
ncbi:MAG TPA: ABC transporter substrate-binding protein, partial [Dehalococcoidia bacterium]|nr:ABC transporter substrate-binding protein [Dehalococcoidia bacterium]